MEVGDGEPLELGSSDLEGDVRGKEGNLASSIYCLFRLARKYLSVQATSTPAERVMSSMGIVLEKRRQSMTGELFAEIMFLSDTV